MNIEDIDIEITDTDLALNPNKFMGFLFATKNELRQKIQIMADSVDLENLQKVSEMHAQLEMVDTIITEYRKFVKLLVKKKKERDGKG